MSIDDSRIVVRRAVIDVSEKCIPLINSPTSITLPSLFLGELEYCMLCRMARMDAEYALERGCLVALS